MPRPRSRASPPLRAFMHHPEGIDERHGWEGGGRESDKEQQRTDESAEPAPREEEGVNDPLTRSGSGAPKVSWQATPE